MYQMLWIAAKMLYATMLRQMLRSAIDDPDTDWDDKAIKIADAVFDYEEEN